MLVNDVSLLSQEIPQVLNFFRDFLNGHAPLSGLKEGLLLGLVAHSDGLIDELQVATHVAQGEIVHAHELRGCVVAHTRAACPLLVAFGA